MPEGDTLRRTAEALQPRLVGKVVRRAQPVSIARLAGRRVDSVDARGKHLLMRFDSDLVLHSYMRNIYRCEAMWIHRVNPWTAVAAMDDAALAELYATARRLMRDSVAGEGFRHRRAAHARGGRPCPRCGTPIAVQRQGEMGRLSYYCLHCQGGPRDLPPTPAGTREEAHAAYRATGGIIGHRVGNIRFLLLTTRGAKSGLAWTLPPTLLPWRTG